MKKEGYEFIKEKKTRVIVKKGKRVDDGADKYGWYFERFKTKGSFQCTPQEEVLSA